MVSLSRVHRGQLGCDPYCRGHWPPGLASRHTNAGRLIPARGAFEPQAIGPEAADEFMSAETTVQTPERFTHALERARKAPWMASVPSA